MTIMKNFTLLLFFTLLINVAGLAQKTQFTTEDAIKVKSFNISDITDDGKYIVGSVRSRSDRFNIDHRRFGDPNYVSPSTMELALINTENGERQIILPEKSIAGNAGFSHDGSSLAYILYENPDFNLYIYDIAKKKSRRVKIKSDMKIASNSRLLWTPGNESIIISLRDKGWAEKGDSLFKEATLGPITVYDSKKPFLKWDAISNHSSLSVIALIDINKGSLKQLLPEGQYSGLLIPEKGNQLVFSEILPEKTVYDRKGGTDYGLFAIDFNKPGDRDTIIAISEKRISTNWNNSKSHFAYADSGKIFIKSLTGTKGMQVSTDTVDIVKEDTSKAKFTILAWSNDDTHILARSKSAYWKIKLKDRQMEKVYTLPEDSEKAPGLSPVYWSDDLNSLYMSYSAKDKWERGLVKYNIEKQEFTDLVKDSNLYSRWMVAKDGSRILYSFSNGDMPSDIFVSDLELREKKQLTDLNPWIKNKTLTRTELVKYLDSDGKELYGILYYPVNYEEGKKYPLVCEIYETFFNNGYSYSMNLVANAGYFGFKPSVNLINGYPGEAWIKGITSGINKLIERGIVDGEKLGVHGTSYGGYAASLLISQTDRFAAAINISGKTNIISFLGDSPRIGTRNYAAAEVGQDRIGETLWDAPLKYFNTSAVMFADRINTPHLLLTGDGDWNVPALNTRELYYAMRRLGKEVVWVNYVNGGHGAGGASNEADFIDQWERIINWYEEHFNKKDEE